MSKQNLMPDLLSVIDSILAEAGDERAPVKFKPSISEMGVGDVAYGIAVQAIGGKWPADELGPYIARFAIDYASERQRTIQGWVDRLRGIRAALEKQP